MINKKIKNKKSESYSNESYDEITSESEDENAKLLTDDVDKRLNNLLKMIKENNPSLKDYSSLDFLFEVNAKKSKEEKNTKNLKEVIVEQLLNKKKDNITYNEKQNKIKEEFLLAVDKINDDQKAESEANDLIKEKKEPSIKKEKSKEDNLHLREIVNEEDDEKFLKSFFEEKLWKKSNEDDKVFLHRFISLFLKGRKENFPRLF